MDVTKFLMFLSVYTIISSLVTEAIKKLITEKEKFPNNILAVIVSITVGLVGTLIYYQLNSIVFSTNNIIYAILLGLSSGVCSMISYDKFKQSILQIKKMNEDNEK